jgi:hypothetical protein
MKYKKKVLKRMEKVLQAGEMSLAVGAWCWVLFSGCLVLG